ncbi:hypothetical protein HNQ77_000977 [Silvibacterium bohemicum]|uniref:Uncharacterized protein n=1 Tax=Silvibacterium bohemicum TaxID=1577686 RepID=A0A841JP25_9BACT|nr:DUF692 domain-containing protein [Silvibacterium bohemicum]MBB6143033.1 hypothetical protein [Silvibacterium bohemicum]
MGIGLRTPHSERFLDPQAPPAIPWLEVLAENYFDRGGIRHQMLCRIAERYPISVHGVALSLGSSEGIVPEHLERLALLVEDVEPRMVSEHLAWSRSGDIYYNDLLPLPLTEETLDIVSTNVDRTQNRLGRTILVENPSGYLAFEQSTMSEAAFLTRLTERTGCGLLLDVNNLFISGANLGVDVGEWLAVVPPEVIGEIHLAGHEEGGTPDHPLLIDTHGAPVTAEVWHLYAAVLQRIGPRPTMIEWDSDVPSLDVLLDEAARAQKIMDRIVESDAPSHAL